MRVLYSRKGRGTLSPLAEVAADMAPRRLKILKDNAGRGVKKLQTTLELREREAGSETVR